MTSGTGSGALTSPPEVTRASRLLEGERLEALSVGYNVAEGLLALTAAAVAGSAVLAGFGGDSLIEVTSAVLVWRRLRGERLGEGLEANVKMERRASRWAGGLLLALAAVILLESARQLLTGTEPAPSRLGMVLTALSAAAMPLLARWKLRLATDLKSPALRADAHQQVACAWLSVTALAGLGLNAALGWWWADPAAALLLVPWISREGWEAWRGEEVPPGEDGARGNGE